MAVSGRVTIGKVVASLKAKYPDLSISKVRYLENEGLLAPARTEGRYRLYSQSDIDRLERILYLQKNRFLPLAVIRRMIENGELDTASEEEGEVSAVEDREILEGLHSLDKMSDLTGASASFVRALADAGVIELKRSPQGRDLVEGRDLSVIRTADELRRFGIEPKHLRQYVISARRESSIFEQALAIYTGRGGKTVPDSVRFQSGLDELIELTGTLRTHLIKRGIAQQFNTGNNS